MSGRGKWWKVGQLNSGVKFVLGMAIGARPDWTRGMDIDTAVAKMVHEGEADAVAAFLECPDDGVFQKAVREYE